MFPSPPFVTWLGRHAMPRLRRLWRSPRVGLGFSLAWWIWCGAWALKIAHDGPWWFVAFYYAIGTAMTSIALYWWNHRRDTFLEGRCPVCELPYDRHGTWQIAHCRERIAEDLARSAPPVVTCPACQLQFIVETSVAPGQAFPPELEILCPRCRHHLKLVRDDGDVP